MNIWGLILSVMVALFMLATGVIMLKHSDDEDEYVVDESYDSLIPDDPEREQKKASILLELDNLDKYVKYLDGLHLKKVVTDKEYKEEMKQLTIKCDEIQRLIDEL